MTISRGVPAGTDTRTHDTSFESLETLFVKVAISGAASTRLSEVTPSRARGRS